MAANLMSQTGMDGISIPTYLPIYLSIYLPTYLPTLATLDNRSCISADCSDKLCGRITVRRSGLQARRAPRITAMLVPDDPPISYDDDDYDDVDDDDDDDDDK